MKQQDFYELAARMEEECGDWENAEGLSREAEASILRKAEELERRSAEEKKTAGRRFRLRKRYAVLLAAAMTLLLGLGVAGDRAWISDSSDLERTTEVTTKVNNEEKESVLREEEKIYQEIGETLGIVPMRLGYFPEGMELDSYTIMEATGWAYLCYLYEEHIIYVQMAKEHAETSINIQWDGSSRKLENIANIYGHEIEAYCIDEEHHNYGARLSYGNGYYDIFGTFEEETDFLEILNWIYFKKL